ncbi:MAG: hypothetical protein KAI47_12025, partial [Deltaproteobacteria bacterium]|nr:hypothetical protein [Deltaproteobacteria bacterium]
PSTSPDTGDINSIWHQADVQLQLTWAAWWVLGPAESSTLNIATCGLGWDPDDKFSVSNAVDLYGIRYLGGAAGYGACRVDGFVAVQSAWLDNPNSQHPLVDSRLIGHEFGHYLGGLGHSAGWDDLMLSSVGGSNVTPGQVQLMRSFISNRVDSNPATDYWKDR